LPNLLIRGIQRAVEVSAALKLFVCNVATQPGETDGMDLGEHMEILERHVGRGLFSLVLANDAVITSPGDIQVQPVELRFPPDAAYDVLRANVVNPAAAWRHDCGKLAKEIMHIYQRERLSMRR
jgi:uncharacterized cofD-like protein